MGRSYQQFSLEERCEIARRRAAGESIRQVAAALDRAPSSISRELKRNSTAPARYKPVFAGEQANARRWRGSRLLRDPDLQALVLDRMARGWSPQQVAGRLAREHGRTVISHETIYRFIAAQIARTKNYAWRLYLPRAKSKRGFRGRKGGRAAQHIKERTPIHQRPRDAADRTDPGHWEADLMLFAAYGQAVLTLHERSSRLIAVRRQPNKAAAPVAAALEALLAPLPESLRQTITFDNGTEFALHHALRDKLGIQTFFCDPHAPWQKGGIENAIGRLRRSLPRKTDLATLPDQQVLELARRYNQTPRKCLDFQTPAEVFSSLLHFKCESTRCCGRDGADASAILSAPRALSGPMESDPGSSYLFEHDLIRKPVPTFRDHALAPHSSRPGWPPMAIGLLGPCRKPATGSRARAGPEGPAWAIDNPG